MTTKLLQRALDARAALIKPATDAIALAETEDRELTADEATTVRSFSATENADVRDLDLRIANLREQAERDRQAASVLPTAGGAIVRSEPMTYSRHDRRTSYFRDLGLAHVGGNPQAKARLARHAKEVEVELPRLDKKHQRLLLGDDAEGREAIEAMSGVTTRDITRVDGAGGEFVPPIWFIDEYAEMIRAGRITANLVRSIPLPGGTDSISLPRITTGTAAAIQTADNAAVQETDMVTNSTTAGVKTVAGQQDVALQLLEQSPLMFDEIIFSDLTADYNAKLNVQVLNGSGSNGQHTGFLAQSSTTSVSYTDGSPTIAEWWPSGAQLLSQVTTARKMPVELFVFHPRRWYWMQGQLDGSSRPYVVPTQQGPLNALAQILDPGIAEGLVGTWHGVPVYIDAGMHTTFTAGAGAAGTEDAILCFRKADHILFEGALRTRALPEVLSGTLTVRLQVYGYSAFISGRFPAGIGKIVGTGMAAPSGY